MKDEDFTYDDINGITPPSQDTEIFFDNDESFITKETEDKKYYLSYFSIAAVAVVSLIIFYVIKIIN